jgi:hypothetical protein
MKAAIKETFQPVKGLWKQLFQTREEEVCSNVKQQLVRVQNKESAAR